jgi:AbrB family looped-hinge helix DNA binding protein
MTENAPGAPFVAKVVGKGKVTVPKNVRDLLNLKDGDYAEFTAVRRISADSQPDSDTTTPGGE